MAPGQSTVPTAAERLRRIEAVTESKLAHLDAEELLVELLDRVRELLGVDTAAVLLLDPAGTHVVATAARGLEEEVAQGVRIPLGKGFAGTVAATKRPVVLDRVDSSTVLNPILWDKGISSMLGVPLLVTGSVLGVLHVGSLAQRAFTDEDTKLLQLVADRMAAAVQYTLSRAERSAAVTLQRSLLPDRLPSVAGLELDSRYVAGGGGGVGGDWYDVFALADGRLCVVVGDVVGRGLPAAVSMGRLRGAVRAYALEFDDPAVVLGRLDRLVRHFEHDVMATVLCAIVEPGNGRLLLSCAGHPPPVLAVPGQPARVFELPADLPMGIDVERPRRTTVMELPDDATVCFYTDGLVERRRASLDEGLDRLCRAVTPGSAASVCASVMSRLVGAQQPTDDIALLVMRRTR